MKITKLSKEKEAQIPLYVEKWNKIGLSTVPTDEEKAIADTIEVYRSAGCEPPASFIFVDNPVQGCILSYVLENLNVKEAKKLEKNNKIPKDIDIVTGEHKEMFSLLVEKLPLRYHYQLSKLFSVAEKDLVRKHIYKCGYGHYDASWLSFYDFFRDDLPEEIAAVVPLINQAENVGPWWPYDEACVLCKKPLHIHRDDDGRLHAETTSAIEYGGDFKIYAWHGIRLPAWIIETPEKITPELVLQENNQEIRRIMCEKYGWDNFIERLSPTEIHRDETGILVETDSLGRYLDGEDRVARFVLVVCPTTGRRYALRVDPGATTARAGVASTWKMVSQEFTPSQHT